MTLSLTLSAFWWLFELVHFIFGSVRSPMECPKRFWWGFASAICFSIAILAFFYCECYF